MNIDVPPVDVLVIGGGPAGATIAARLAQLGHDVVLVDRGRPRRRIETLAPGTVDLLALTGADRLVHATGFARVTGSTVDWGRGPQRRATPGAALLVERAEFDALLLVRAVEVGVRVVRPGVARRRRDLGDGSIAVAVDTPDGRVDVRARFVVDAGGRRRAGATITAPRTLAVTCRVAGPASGPSVLATPHAWFWSAPAAGGREVTAFVDPAWWGSVLQRSARDRFGGLLADARALAPGEGRLAGRVRTDDATPMVGGDVASRRHLAVGDVAVALDPLSSTGVQKAVQGALSAAVVVNTVLRRPHDADAALEHHRRAVAATAQHHAEWASETYAEAATVFDTPFWRSRAATALRPDEASTERATVAPRRAPHPDHRVRVSGLATVVETTRIDGEFVTRGSAVRHPGLDGEVAYLGGVPLVPLLGRIASPTRLADLAVQWARDVPAVGDVTAARLAGWLYARGVLEDAGAA